MRIFDPLDHKHETSITRLESRPLLMLEPRLHSHITSSDLPHEPQILV